jgi:hypothetical protein
MSDRTHQKAQVLGYLKTHPSIDPWTCALKFGHWKLSSVIGELRHHDGHYIESSWRKTKSGKRHLVYFLVRANGKAA